MAQRAMSHHDTNAITRYHGFHSARNTIRTAKPASKPFRTDTSAHQPQTIAEPLAGRRNIANGASRPQVRNRPHVPSSTTRCACRTTAKLLTTGFEQLGPWPGRFGS